MAKGKKTKVLAAKRSRKIKDKREIEPEEDVQGEPERVEQREEEDEAVAVLRDDGDDGSDDGGDDVEEGGDEKYGNFLKDLAAIEGAPRFLHYNDDRDVDQLPFAAALKDATTGVSKGDSADGSSAPPSVPIDSFLTDLPATKSGAAIKKALIKSAKSEDELAAEKKRKKKKRKKGKDATEDQDDEEAPSKSLRLPMPLSAPEKERTARSALYERTKEDVKVWDAVVHSSRAAETKKFPLVKPDMKMATNKDYSASFRPRNELEEQVMALLRKSNKAEESSRLSESEEAMLAQMSLREAEEKRREMIRLKLLQQHQQAKLARQNKIKSRKFRKLARKTKEKQREKEIEELKQTNPELALEKMKEDEKTRILERATLKHRNNSKFMQLQGKRARKDKESQRQLHEGLVLHRTLKSKLHDDVEEEPEMEEGASQDLEEVENLNEEESVEAFNANLKQFWQEQNEAKLRLKKRQEETKRQLERERLEMASSSMDDLFAEAGRVMQRKLDKGGEDSDNQSEGEEEEEEDESLALKTDASVMDKGKEAEEIEKRKKKKEKAILDPDKFIQTTDLTKKGPREIEDDEGVEDFDAQAQAISEAFAGDDVTMEFKTEKQALIDKDRPKDIDLTLPGWGSWGGEGIKVSKRKRKRFTIKAPPPPKRRDENRGHLIINEKGDDSLRKHQVGSVPFPFTTVADFEASIRTPISDTFIPRTAFNKLIKPKVQTKMGAVIEPMNEDELVKRKIV